MNSRPPDPRSAEPAVPPRDAADATAADATHPGDSGASLAGMPKIVRFAALARCGDEIWIENEGQIYRLRKTRQGKLILTK